MNGETLARAVIIGEGAMPVQCANILLKHGFQVVGASSPDDPLRNWAETHRVRHHTALSDFAKLVSSQEFEYLFSIVNYRILPASVLTTAKRYAINYHDALLPRFAGAYATSWAIMGGEQIHGITWHVMTEGVDEGDILKQSSIPVSPGETAATLNLKCCYTALYAFEELAQELKSGKEAPVGQNLNEQTYFAFTKRPNAGCLIAFDSPAAQIEAFTRALEFGSYTNPIGLPKILIGRHCYAVPGVVVSDLTSGAEAGTVTSLSEHSFRVSTRTEDVIIPSVRTLYGEDVSLNTLIEQGGLAVGSVLQRISPAASDRITRIHTLACRHEKYWVRRLTDLLLRPLPAKPLSGRRSAPWKSIEKRVADNRFALLSDQSHIDCPGESLAIAHALFLASALESDRFDIGFSCPQTDHELAGIEDFFASCLPLRVDLRETKNLAAAVVTISNELKEIKKRLTYMRDLTARNPQLKLVDPLQPAGSDLTSYPHTLRIVCSTYKDEPLGKQCNFHIQEDGKTYRWIYNPDRIDDAFVLDLMREFDTFWLRLASAAGFEPVVMKLRHTISAQVTPDHTAHR